MRQRVHLFRIFTKISRLEAFAGRQNAGYSQRRYRCTILLRLILNFISEFRNPRDFILIMQLQDLAQGTSAKIIDLIGSSRDISQLFDIGVRIGANVRMLRKDTPCVIRVAGARICLRPRQVQVIVQPA